MNYRIDKADLSNARMDNGVLIAKVNLTKAGVYPYLHSDGRLVYEAKLPEEIFSTATIDSANGAAIVDNHPDINQDSGLVTSKNYKDLIKGNVFNVKQDDIYLSGLEKVFDSELQKKILSGEQVQVSIGFEQRTDWTPGEFNGQKYDCAQRDIRINHIAHVEKGRAGEDCRTILDSNKDYAIMQEANNMNDKKLTLRVDNKDYSIPAEVMNYIESLKKTTKKDAEPATMEPPVEAVAAEAPASPDVPSVDMNAIGEKMKMADKIITDIQNKYGIGLSEIMSLLEAKDEMIELYKSKMNGSPEAEAAVADAIGIIRTAEAILPDHKFDSYNLKDIKKTVIKAKLPNYKAGKFDSMTDAELEIGFKAAVEVAKHIAVFGNSEVTAKQDESKMDSLKANLQNAKEKFYSRGIK